MIRYQPLLQVEILHDYFLSRGSTVFEAQPEADQKSLMALYSVPLRECFLNSYSAGGTGLRCSVRTHFKNPHTGTFSLVLKDLKKLVPVRVVNRSGKPVVLDHPLDVQALHSDCTVAIDQIGRNLVMLITAGADNAGAKLSYPYALFSSAIAAFFLAAKASVLYPQFAQHFLEWLYCRFLIAIGRREKQLYPDINPGGGFVGHLRDRLAERWQAAMTYHLNNDLRTECLQCQ